MYVRPGEEVVVHLQFLYMSLVAFDLLAKGFYFLDQLFQFGIVEIVELTDF